MNPSAKKDIYIFISSLIEKAVALSASDIHIDPRESAVFVRFRIAGHMHEGGCFESDLLDLCIGKIKVLAALRSDVHDRSQDGRFYFVSKSTGEKLDVRVSIAPTFFGENCVMRILRPHAMRGSSFMELGMTHSQAVQFKHSLSKTSGLIIVAGPTGSGKTSTLYAALRYLARGIDINTSMFEELSTEKNIVTIEDPVESVVPTIRQIPISVEKGFGFKEALRGILRQDPDVIMIGEIRDKETAMAAVQTALTGHLVLTTIHAPSAASVIPRLIDMGIEAYLLSSAVSLILSQRLVRVFDYSIGLYGERRGVFELVQVDSQVRDMIHQKKTAYEIERYLVDSGHVLLRDACSEMYSRHVTTEEEIKRINLDIFS